MIQRASGGRTARHEEVARVVVDERRRQLGGTRDIGPCDHAIGLVLADQRPRLVQRPVDDDDRVAAGELAVVEVLGSVRARGVAEPVDGLDEVRDADDESSGGAQHDS